MLGGGSEGAMQLPGRTSVAPGGQSWPAVTRVPPPLCAASTAPIAPLIRMTRTVRKNRMESPFSHEPNLRPEPSCGTSVRHRLVSSVPQRHRGFCTHDERLDEFVRDAGARHVDADRQYARGACLEVDDVLRRRGDGGESLLQHAFIPEG